MSEPIEGELVVCERCATASRIFSTDKVCCAARLLLELHGKEYRADMLERIGKQFGQRHYLAVKQAVNELWALRHGVTQPPTKGVAV